MKTFLTFLKTHRVTLCLSSIFLLSRTGFIWKFPLFEDEAAYIYFASLAKDSLLLHWSESFHLGLGPVFPVIVSFVLRFIDDPVLAGRTAAALLSLVSFYSIGVIAESIFDRQASFFARLLYMILPYIFIHDRLAMLDSPAMAFVLYAIVGFIRLAQDDLRFWIPVVISMYLGVLTKPTGFMAFLLGPLIAGAIKLSRKQKMKQNLFFFLLLIMLEASAMSLIFATIAPSLDVFFPVYQRVVDTKTSIPFWLIRENSHKALLWMRQYSSAAFLFLVGVGGLLTLFRRPKFIPAFGVWGMVTLVLSVVVSKFWYPRYILPSISLLILLASFPLALTWSVLKKTSPGKLLFYILLGIMSLPLVTNDFRLAINPRNATMPGEDRVLYFELWTSGYFAEKAKFFFEDRLKKEKKVIVFTDTMKVLHVGITMPLESKYSNFQGKFLRELTFAGGSRPKEIEDAAKRYGKVYLVLTRYLHVPKYWDFQEEINYNHVLAIYSYTPKATSFLPFKIPGVLYDSL